MTIAQFSREDMLIAQGREEEMENTEWERKRANAEKDRADAEKDRADAAENRADAAENRADAEKDRADAAESLLELERRKVLALEEKLRQINSGTASKG